MVQVYTLPRDPAESARLDEQHQVWKATLDYPELLHPRISLHNYIGLDISAAQYPLVYPSNTSFDVLNILEPVPAKYEGYFDVIHVRLLVLGLVGEQWHTTARILLAMLKPGGFLQWEEADFAHPIYHSGSDDDTTCSALETLTNHALAVSQPTGWLLDESTLLPGFLGLAGFVEVEERVVGSDAVPEWRERFMRIGIKAFEGILRISKFDEGARVRLVKEAEKAVDEGAWGETKFHVVIGRKKA
ncbi:hypothetical protein B0A48_00359 [Cryoendolithus antarcticus]|uniref:Methyltransferase domain-containing protein n=1 Tax=Cryoendolithus antarcticus TaxID=1507870 RepID=A0A1V8TUF6_9PEZI|nr:hypothetical protein B0A48_00359 [Cryoendolithus antarcticus]